MGVAEGMWKEIHAGRAPSARSLESLVKLDAPVFGQEQRVALEARLDADVLGAGPLREALELPGVSDDAASNGSRSTWAARKTCGDSPCASLPQRAGASTTRAPTSTPSCPAGCDCMRCCRRSSTTAHT